MTAAREILDLARWAPSGDNTQPWRFVVETPDHIVVHGRDTRAECVYDLDGRPSQISLGALLETIALAATRFGRDARITRRQDSADEAPVFDVHLDDIAGMHEDKLVTCITQRTVHRRPLRLRPLTAAEKQALEAAVAPGFRLSWWEGWRRRSQFAWLNFTNAKIRLTLPEAYKVHRDVIEWGAQLSEDRVPSAALGAGVASLILMRWAMASWDRIAFLNRYLAGTVAPRLELDLIPGLACAAHCVIVAQQGPSRLDDYVMAGRALQRFWLTATSLGLQFQPSYTPLVFARYAREGTQFAKSGRAMEQAQAIRARLGRLLGEDVGMRAVFLGRLGAGKPARARSVRLPLERLMKHDAE